MSKPYFVYAVVFEPKAKFIRGRLGQDHLSLLKSAGLHEKFDGHPEQFVMGRFQKFDNFQAVLIDTASDHFTGKTGIERPLQHCGPQKVRVFEECLLRNFLSERVFVLNMGFKSRASGLTERKFSELLKNMQAQKHLARETEAFFEITAGH